MDRSIRKLSALTWVVVLSLSMVTGLGIAPAMAQDAGNAAGNQPLPPGVSEDGVENASDLADAHREALAETGATFAVEARLEVDNDTGVPGANTTENVSEEPDTNGSENATENVTDESGADVTDEPGADENANGSADATARYFQSTTATLGADISPFRLRSTGQYTDGDGQSAYVSDQWANDTVLASQVRFDDETDYYKQYLDDTDNPEDPYLREVPRRWVEEQATGTDLLRATLELGNFTVEDTRQVAGENLTVLRATEAADDSYVGAENVSAFEATVVVDEDGRVRTLNTSVAHTYYDSRYDYEYDYQLLATGDAQVLEPLWLDSALDRVAASVDVNATDRYFEVTNYGPDALPANASVEVARDNVTTDLTLSEPLDSGESVYLSFPTEGGPPELAAEPPAEDAVAPLTGEYDFVVRDGFGTDLLYVSYGFSGDNETVDLEGPAAPGDGENETAVPEA